MIFYREVRSWILAAVIFFGFIFLTKFNIDLVFYFIFYIIGLCPVLIVLNNYLRGQIKFYDPIIICFIIIFQIFGISFFYIILTPINQIDISFGGVVGDFSNYSKEYLIAEAQFILSSFSVILLFTNFKEIKWTTLTYKPNNRFVFKLLFFLSFLILISDYSSNFLESIKNIGTDVKFIDEGGGFSLLKRSIILFAPLIIIQCFPKISFRNYTILILFYSLNEIFQGSRSAFLYFFIFSLQYFYYINHKIPKKMIFVFSTVALFLILSMSLIRSYNTSHLALKQNLESFSDIDNQLLFNPKLLMTSDRVLPIALSLNYIKNLNEDYTYFETLVARPQQVLNIIISNIGYEMKNLKTCDNYTHLWRFKTITNKKKSWSVPLSVPGELFIQFGYLLFFFLAFLYGKVIYFLRKRITRSKNHPEFFTIFIVVLYFSKSISAEVMLYSNIYFLSIPLAIILYKLTKIFTLRKN